MSTTNKILLVDGNALVHRAFHALPPLTAPDGKLVNAVYGFFSIFLAALQSVQPEYAVVAFDEAGPTFRDQLYQDYKATRVKAPQSLYDQIPLIKHLLTAFNIPYIGLQGFEADDIIGTVCQQTTIPIVILTGDNDTFQLVNERVKVMTPNNGSLREPILIDAKGVVKKYGFKPKYLIDYKALRGDPSDNIPGVAGIGEKTATTLVQNYHTVENIYQKLDQISTAVKDKLVANKDNALLSKQLATIVLNAPVKINLTQARLKDFDYPHVVTELEKLGFKSLIKRLPQSIRKTVRQTQPKLL